MKNLLPKKIVPERSTQKKGGTIYFEDNSNSILVT